MGVLMRSEHWPARLAAVVACAATRPYVLGEWDCLRFSCACIDAMTGVDLWPRFSGYRTKRQALVTIARIAPTLGEAITAVLAVPPQPVFLGRRGDIALYRDDAGEEHIGVVLGARVGVLGADGLLQVSLADVRLVSTWRVG